MNKLKKYGVVAAIAAVVALPFVANSLTFNDATADQVWGSNSFTTAGNISSTSGVNGLRADSAANNSDTLGPDGLAFDGNGNLWVAADTRILLFTAPTSDTSANAIATADKILTYRSIDSTLAGLNPTLTDSVALFHKLVVTTTDTDVLWATFTLLDSSAFGVQDSRTTSGIMGMYLSGNVAGSLPIIDTGLVRGDTTDSLAEFVIGPFRQITGRIQPAIGFKEAADTIPHSLRGITAKEDGNTVTLFAADRGFNRVLGWKLYTPNYSELIFGPNSQSARADSKADFVAGQGLFTTSAMGTSNDGETGLCVPVDVAWCYNRLFIADAGNSRVVAVDFFTGNSMETATGDSFGSPVTFAYGDSNTLATTPRTAGANNFATETSFQSIQQLFCDGVSIAVSDSTGSAGNTQGARVLVFTINSDTTADDAIGYTISTRINAPPGIGNAAWQTLRDIAGYGSLIVVSDHGNNRVLGFSGSVGPSSQSATSDGGTCLIEALVSGTSLEAALPAIRSARDASLGSAAGRFLTSAYYSVLGIASLVALIGGAAFAFRRN